MRRFVVAAVLVPLAWGGPLGKTNSREDFQDEDDEEAAAALGWLFEGSNLLDVEGEALIGSDITVWRIAGAYEQQRGDITVGVTLGYTDIDIDYQPPLFSANRSESNREGQLDLGWKANEKLELTGLARVYDGFPDYRSVWIAEYYQQLFGLTPSYREPDPKGWAVGAGAVWDLVPGATRLSMELSFGEDDVVEGWGVLAGPLPEPGRDRVETISGGVIWEQAINGWLKTENALRVQESTPRETRFQAETNWAAALGPDWTLRFNAGGTRESGNFEAYYAGGLVDYEFRPGWHLALNGRYYEDTGEIESSGFSTAAPGLQSFELGASLLYDRGDLAVRLSGGFYNTDFEPLDPTNAFFGRLYRDRDWWVTRLAISYSF